MTLAESFKRRVLSAYVLLALFVAFGLIASWILPENTHDAMTVVGLVPIACAAYLMNVRCPKCRAFLGGAVAIGLLKGAAKNGIETCPSCGLALDGHPGAPGSDT